MATKPRARKQARRDLDPEMYQRAWEVYRTDASERSLAERIGVARGTARALINEGAPGLGLPPLKEKLRAMMSLAQQMDVDEGARAIAMGRGLVHTLLHKYVAKFAGMAPAELPSNPDAVLRLVQYIEKTHARDDEAGLVSAEDLLDAMGGLGDALRTALRRTMPAAEHAEPTDEDLDAIIDHVDHLEDG